MDNLEVDIAIAVPIVIFVTLFAVIYIDKKRKKNEQK